MARSRSCQNRWTKSSACFPNKMMIISEFGLPGIFAKDPEDADRMRVKIIQEQMPELARRDWIAGAILWCYQDYKSRRNLAGGREQGYVEHGLVDEYRQRKPSYYVWKDLNAPAAMEAQWDHELQKPTSEFHGDVDAQRDSGSPVLSASRLPAGVGIERCRRVSYWPGANSHLLT